MIVGLTLFSCSPQVIVARAGYKKYPAIEDKSAFSSPPDTVLSLNKTKLDDFAENLYIGFGIGPETGLSLFLPKISYYDFRDSKFLSTYYGVEGCIGIIEAPWMSLDCLYGVKKSIVTLDGSFGLWWYPGHKYDKIYNSDFHLTLNPKIGLKFWKIWLKGSPSFFVYNYSKGQEKQGIGYSPKLGNLYYNFEILIKM
jgi:hypothetical protein